MWKMADFALQQSSKLISHKIWMIQKSWNFHTVCTYQHNDVRVVLRIIVEGFRLLVLPDWWIALQNQFIEDVLQSLHILTSRSMFIDCPYAFVTCFICLLKKKKDFCKQTAVKSILLQNFWKTRLTLWSMK